MTSTETATTSTAITTATTATSPLFTSIPIPAGIHLSHISVDEATNVYALDSTGKLHIYGGVEWNEFPSPALSSVSVTHGGSHIWALSKEEEGGSNVWRFDESGNWIHPSKDPIVLKGISAGNERSVWGWDHQNIYRWNAISSLFVKVKKPEEWEENTHFISLAVGSDGIVIGVDSTHNVWKWNGGGWLSVPTFISFKKVVVADTDLIAGVDTDGIVFLLTNKRGDNVWVPIESDYTLQAASSKIIWGTREHALIQLDVWTARNSNVTLNLKERRKKHILGKSRKQSVIPGVASGIPDMNTVNGPSTTLTISLVSTASPTAVWVILSNNSFYYYNGAFWTAGPTAISGGGTLSALTWLSAAEDGSVWVLSTANKLYYLNSSLQWVYVSTSSISITGVTCGSKSEVWVWKPSSTLNFYRYDTYSSTFIQIAGPSGYTFGAISTGMDGTCVGYDTSTPQNYFWRWSGGMWGQVDGPIDPGVGTPYYITGVYCASKYVAWSVGGGYFWFWYGLLVSGTPTDAWNGVVTGVYSNPDASDGAVSWGVYNTDNTKLRCDPTWDQMAYYT